MPNPPQRFTLPAGDIAQALQQRPWHGQMGTPQMAAAPTGPAPAAAWTPPPRPVAAAPTGVFAPRGGPVTAAQVAAPQPMVRPPVPARGPVTAGAVATAAQGMPFGMLAPRG